jgi:hypothetical protein
MQIYFLYELYKDSVSNSQGTYFISFTYINYLRAFKKMLPFMVRPLHNKQTDKHATEAEFYYVNAHGGNESGRGVKYKLAVS